MRIALLLSVVGVLFSSAAIESPRDDSHRNMVMFLMEYLEIKYSAYSFDDFLYVAVKQQKMYHIQDQNVIGIYAISTAINGLGGNLGSHRTPIGLHRIKEKVGNGVPVGGILKEKTFTGELANIIDEPVAGNGDQITTRLLHLEGLEPGLNKGEGYDSYYRGIMIHGTPEEGLIGTPSSHGCIRMKNQEVLELFESVKSGTFVVILNN